MAQRGSYPKGAAKRAEILQAALDTIGRHGYHRTTIRQLAEAVGLSQNGLLHYFGSKEELFAEVLRRRDEIGIEVHGRSLDDAGEIVPRVIAMVRDNAGTPGFIQLYTRLANDAAEDDHPAHAYFVEHYEAARALGTQTFARLEADGRLGDAADPSRLAVLLFSLLDGLQMQWMYDRSLDIADHLEYFFSLLGLQAPDSDAQTAMRPDADPATSPPASDR